MVALIMSTLVLVLLLAPIFPLAKRRPVGTPLSWGEAMVGAVYVFFIFFWVYAVIPHQWLNFAGAELDWAPNRIWLGPNAKEELIVPVTHWVIGWPWRLSFPIDIHAQIFQDVIVVLIYVAALGGNIWMWAWWQNRGKRAENLPEPKSTFGRPLVKRS